MSTENKTETEEIEQQSGTDTASPEENGKSREFEEPRISKDPGLAWAEENAEATGVHSAEDMQSAGILIPTTISFWKIIVCARFLSAERCDLYP
jgi:hypothetical protein